MIFAPCNVVHRQIYILPSGFLIPPSFSGGKAGLGVRGSGGMKLYKQRVPDLHGYNKIHILQF